jgi:Arm DNA-binding domain
MPVGCIVKTNQNGNLALRLFFKGLRSWEGIRALKDTPENRDFLRAKAKVISREIREGKFDYLRRDFVEQQIQKSATHVQPPTLTPAQ